jgi:hypothetical protein
MHHALIIHTNKMVDTSLAQLAVMEIAALLTVIKFMGESGYW